MDIVILRQYAAQHQPELASCRLVRLSQLPDRHQDCDKGGDGCQQLGVDLVLAKNEGRGPARSADAQRSRATVGRDQGEFVRGAQPPGPVLKVQEEMQA